MEFPAGGLLDVEHAAGSLTIEGRDQPGIEIRTIKTTKDDFAPADRQQGLKDLDQVRFAPERKADKLTLTMMYPRYGHFLFYAGSTRFHLETHIYVPRDARLDIHGEGQIYIEQVTGAVQADISHGTILLRLAENGQYNINARSRFGNVVSDFPGQERKTSLQVGHQFTERYGATNKALPGTSGQKLDLRTGYGDIVILKIRKPPEPLAAKVK